MALPLHATGPSELPRALARGRGPVAYCLHDHLVIGVLVFVVVLAGLGTFLAHRHYMTPPVGSTLAAQSPRTVIGTWPLLHFVNAGAVSMGGGGFGANRAAARRARLARTCVYLDYAPLAPTAVNITWQGGREATIASTRVDVATADIHDNEPFSEWQYTWRWIEIVVASGLLWALGLGLTTLLAARRRRRAQTDCLIPACSPDIATDRRPRDDQPPLRRLARPSAPKPRPLL